MGNRGSDPRSHCGSIHTLADQNRHIGYHLSRQYWLRHYSRFVFATPDDFPRGIDVSLGYHRLWSHRSYTASWPLKLWLAVVGAGAMQHSIINWSYDHRSHHRYTDTVKDPYSVRKGLLYAHMGWLIFKHDPECQAHADISDLTNDPIVAWQDYYYSPIAMVIAYILPCCIGGLWGDYWGGLIYAGVLRTFLVQQSTFCVNSVAHWLGDHTFDDRNSPRDHAITALMTFGEGYHNFHHEFPSDYRNAIAWHQYDPTKWMIWLWKEMGLAHNLKTFRQNEIEKGRLQQEQKKLNQRQTVLHSPLEHLPVMEWDDYQNEVTKGRPLLVIAGVIHDVENFVDDHPGGRALINSGIGKDATTMFHGGIYNRNVAHHKPDEHLLTRTTDSKAAHRLMATMQVGILRGGCEVEIWKSSQETKILDED